MKFFQLLVQEVIENKNFEKTNTTTIGYKNKSFSGKFILQTLYSLEEFQTFLLSIKLADNILPVDFKPFHLRSLSSINKVSLNEVFYQSDDSLDENENQVIDLDKDDEEEEEDLNPWFKC
ncbi:hypothetical protein DLAC_08882 [Tieghemostelium lacteum]|uniref:Uncharacterized protein n=1 Tax=Tieghemostelium lacteum TaxID=361077 RepID=A0A151Z8J7_TIELA|nr:hypothetical protein DLAC_08882 [Tieghemostelium lacteum]|eukprot:KYQ90280.1 hypothetical protein DLAC_08882 [Tieghemostelium lacteum]